MTTIDISIWYLQQKLLLFFSKTGISKKSPGLFLVTIYCSLNGLSHCLYGIIQPQRSGWANLLKVIQHLIIQINTEQKLAHGAWKSINIPSKSRFLCVSLINRTLPRKLSERFHKWWHFNKIFLLQQSIRKRHRLRSSRMRLTCWRSSCGLPSLI